MFSISYFISFVCLFVWWGLTPLSTIFELYRGGHFIGGGNRRTRRKNPRPVASHWQTLSHTVVNPILIKIRTHTISGDRLWLHMQLYIQPPYDHGHGDPYFISKYNLSFIMKYDCNALALCLELFKYVKSDQRMIVIVNGN